MKLKELKNDDHNILDFISFFDDIADTKPYFIELSFMYGERELLTKVEEMMLDSGLGGIGMIFDLKRSEWEQLEIISKKLVDDGMLETTITKTTDRTNSTDRTGTNSSDVTDDDYVVAYDETVDTKQSGTVKSDVVENTETINNEETGTDKTVKTGYDKERLDYISKLFRNYPDYRLQIYNDIVEKLCIKGYN